MRKQIVAAVLAAVFALGVAAGVALAAPGVSVDIPFSFIVQDKEMPAGRYEIRTNDNTETKLAIKDVRSGGTVLVPVIERLANIGVKEPKLVFDKMGDGKVYLSEVHVPHTDGFLVGIAKGRETHVTVTGK